MNIQLSEHFTVSKLLKFVAPSIIMMIFTSIYGVVDGFFVSNFVGKTQFAAVNLIMPFIMAVVTVGFMLGTGGSALVAKTLGEGDESKAKKYFSMIVYTALIGGAILSVISFFLVRPIAVLFGAEGELLEYSVLYAHILVFSLPMFMLQNVFQVFFVTAEKPHLGLYVIISAGVTNMILDFLFIAVFHFGLAGAAAATAIGETVGGLVPMIYFARPNSSRLKLVRTKPEWKALGQACFNGSSELMTNLSASVVNMLYNFQLMKFAGQDGIAAYGVIMYVNFIFIAIFIGFSIGSSPIIGYHYGAENNDELKSLLKKSLLIIATISLALTVFAELLSSPLAKIFVSYDENLFAMTRDGYRLYTLSYLICGFNIWGSAFFTALNNGFMSATISFLRILVFQIICLLLLPAIFDVNGIWISIVVAEFLAVSVTATLIIKNRKKYQYT